VAGVRDKSAPTVGRCAISLLNSIIAHTADYRPNTVTLAQLRSGNPRRSVAWAWRCFAAPKHDAMTIMQWRDHWIDTILRGNKHLEDLAVGDCIRTHPCSRPDWRNFTAEHKVRLSSDMEAPFVPTTPSEKLITEYAGIHSS
jgi:hypothetical protein